ncbi:hypothetical protein GCM10010276_23440 [Streptomyces longisporus]|uniref:Transposase n=1 Tax=Streptomyces longisporus TaxID=1948 RepID=A0ABP5YRP3_STRLO
MRVAGRRWTVEETFQAGKGLTGLDEHQVRRWASWHRWVTLAMLAHAFLTVVRADEHARHPKPDGLISLTCNETSACSSRSSSGPPTARPTDSTAPTGDAVTRPDPRRSTINDKPPRHEVRDLQLEY